MVPRGGGGGGGLGSQDSQRVIDRQTNARWRQDGTRDTCARGDSRIANYSEFEHNPTRKSVNGCLASVRCVPCMRDPYQWQFMLQVRLRRRGGIRQRQDIPPSRESRISSLFSHLTTGIPIPVCQHVGSYQGKAAASHTPRDSCTRAKHKEKSVASHARRKHRSK